MKYMQQDLYRGFCEFPAAGPEIEHVYFVEAHSAQRAADKALAAIAALSELPVSELSTYNTDSFAEMMDRGMSQEIDLRLFETGWQNLQVRNWASMPLFLVRDPTYLLQTWGRLQVLLTQQYADLEAAVVPFLKQATWPQATAPLDEAGRRRVFDFLDDIYALLRSWSVASAEQRERLVELQKTLKLLRS